MTFQNRYDYCMKKFINIDVGFAGIILYPFVSLGCYIYAFVYNFEFALLIIMIILYYILKNK